jgi:hypothetical protein
MPQGSPLREPVNRALLKIIDTDDWLRLKKRYKGALYRFRPLSSLGSGFDISRLGRAPSIMLGFVPLPNLRK